MHKRERRRLMIGVFDYTVLLTYLSTVSAVAGILLAATGHEMPAVIILVACGIIDLLDGPVARTKKNRTDDEKNFGIQIDSLNDLISFGVLPAVIGYMNHPGITPEKIVFILFPLCGLIRLAWYNVQEIRRQQETDERRKYFTGVPITTSSIVVPILFVAFRDFLPDLPFYIILTVCYAVLGFLYISRIRIRKPQKTGFIILLCVGVAAIIYLAIRLILKHLI